MWKPRVLKQRLEDSLTLLQELQGGDVSKHSGRYSSKRSLGSAFPWLDISFGKMESGMTRTRTHMI